MTIGNKELIAFDLSQSASNGLTNLRFFIGTRLLSDEPVFFPTYKAQIELLLRNLTERKYEIDNNVDPFEALSGDRVDHKHLVTLDETIDQYSIHLFTTKEEATFIWECWDSKNCNTDHKLNQHYSITMKFDFLKETLEILKNKKTFANKM